MGLLEIAKESGRDYITPEDVTEATRGCDWSIVQRELLCAIAHGIGCEDVSLCAFNSLGGLDCGKFKETK